MTTFKLRFTATARKQLEVLSCDKGLQRQLKAVRKTLGLMEINLRHPSLNTHEFSSLKGKEGEKVFESYAQNRTPGAYRVFWHYGPDHGVISVMSVIPHP